MSVTVKEFARGIKQMRKSMDSIVLPPIRKHSKQLAKDTRKELKKTRLGRHVWRKGGNVGTPGVKVLRSQFSRSGGQFTGGIKIFGLARNILSGEPTRPHRIRAKRGPFVWFRVGGVLKRGTAVNHPGGRIRKEPVHEKLLRRIQRPFNTDVTKALEKFYARVVAK